MGLKIFVYRIEDLPGMETYLTRHLICSSDKVGMREDGVSISIEDWDSVRLSDLHVQAMYLVEFEQMCDGCIMDRKKYYYKVFGFEVDRPGSRLNLFGNRIGGAEEPVDVNRSEGRGKGGEGKVEGGDGEEGGEGGAGTVTSGGRRGNRRKVEDVR